MRLLLAGACLMITMHVNAETFTLPEAGVSFAAPDGFTQLSQHEIAQKYLSNRAPTFVVGNSNRATTIALDLKSDELPEDKLSEAKSAFEAVFNRIIPGIEWKQRKIIELQQRQWIYFEMTSRAVDADIYNIMLITPYHGKMLVFNFNSTKQEFPKMELELRKSIQTISVPLS